MTDVGLELGEVGKSIVPHPHCPALCVSLTYPGLRHLSMMHTSTGGQSGKKKKRRSSSGVIYTQSKENCKVRDEVRRVKCKAEKSYPSFRYSDERNMAGLLEPASGLHILTFSIAGP